MRLESISDEIEDAGGDNGDMSVSHSPSSNASHADAVSGASHVVAPSFSHTRAHHGWVGGAGVGGQRMPMARVRDGGWTQSGGVRGVLSLHTFQTLAFLFFFVLRFLPPLYFLFILLALPYSISTTSSSPRLPSLLRVYVFFPHIRVSYACIYFDPACTLHILISRNYLFYIMFDRTHREPMH
jgi:hypothetical protein